MKRPEGFTLYHDRIKPLMEDYTDEELGQIFRALYNYSVHDTIPTLSRELMSHWKIARANIDEGRVSFAQTCEKNKYTAICREWNKKKENKDKVPPAIWEWWANQPGYTPELFKKETWYDDALAEYKRLHTTPVNVCTRPLTNVTNPSQYHNPGPGPNPSPGPGPNPSPSPGPSLGPSTGNMEGAARMIEKAEEMRRKNIEERHRSIASGAASNDKGR